MALKVGELVAFAKLDDAGFASGVRGIEQDMQRMQVMTSGATARLEDNVVSSMGRVHDSLDEGLGGLDFDDEFRKIAEGFDGVGDEADGQQGRIASLFGNLQGFLDKAGGAIERTAKRLADIGDAADGERGRLDVVFAGIRDSLDKAGAAATGTAKGVGLIGIAATAASLGVAGIAGGLALGVVGLGGFLAMNDKLKAAFTDVGKVALEAFQKAAEPLQGPLHKGLARLTEEIGPLAKSLGEAFTAAAPLIETAFDAAISVIDSLVAHLPAIVEAGVPVAQFLLTVIGGAVSGAVSGIAWLIAKFDELKASFASGSGPLSEWGGKISEIVGQAKAVFADVFGSIGQWVSDNQSTIQGWADAIQTGMSTMLSAISSALDAIKAVWDVWGTTILDALGSIIGGLLGAWNGLWEAIGGVFEVFAGIFTGDWSRAWEGLKSIVSGVWNALFAVVEGAGKAIQGLMNKAGELVMSAGAAAWNGLLGLGRKAWDALTKVVSEGVDNTVTFVKALPGKILDGLGKLGSLLLGVGKDLINGLIEGIKAMAQRAIDAVTGVVGDAIQGAKNLLGIQSPSKVFREIGAYSMQGFAEGIERGGVDAIAAALKVAKQATQVVKGVVSADLFSVDGVDGEIARLLGGAKMGLDVQALAPKVSPPPAPKKPAPRTDPNDVTYDRNPPRDNSGYVEPSSYGVGQPPVVVNMHGTIVREDADIDRFGAQFGMQYSMRGAI